MALAGCSSSIACKPFTRAKLRPASSRNMSLTARAGGADPGISAWVEEHLGKGAVTGVKFLGGSSWSSAYAYDTDSGDRLFVKTALGRGEGMFKGEALGLQAMYHTHSLRIPQVLHYGPLPSAPAGGALRGGGSFIVMEYLDLGGRCDQRELGVRLARMHLAEPLDEHARRGQFGFGVDNTIGGTPQPNGWADSWVEFYAERRLRHMLRLAGDSRLSAMGQRLADALPAFFEGIEVKPSILHGDLWSGNIAAVGGEPAVFDPACYYGHHEAEFGMSWCAGFGGAFWEGYNSLIPRAPGWDERHQIYSLYHYLNHLVLFGSGYYGQCEQILSRLTRKL